MLQAPARWQIAPCSAAAVRTLERELGLHRATAEVLVRRGHAAPAAARAFLDEDGPRHDPLLLADMEVACARVEAAVAAGEPVCVHGDYDVDGIAATALAVRALRRAGADVRWHLPSRFEEGYGLAVETVERLAADGVRLLVTVDCGVTAVEAVARARELGVDVIVTDHHQPGDELPGCTRVVMRPSDYPFPELCGTGVAFKFAQALEARAGGDGAACAVDLDLVALATVADVVPLLDENRGLVRAGLRRLARTDKPGLRALMASARVDRARVRAGDIGFRLAPRINAAGRLCHPGVALELLLTPDEGRARELAAELESLNRERQAVEDAIQRSAVEQIEAQGDGWRARRAWVLSSREWHEGVIGIVASRLVERYGRPVVLIAEREGEGKGSGRSIPAFDLHAALRACAGHLGRFGGHRAAAGLSIDPDEIEAFGRSLAEHAAGVLTDDDLRPRHRIDAVAAPAELSLELADELSRLEPFGLGNPAVTLLAPAARLHAVTRMGEGRHLRLTVESGGFRCEAVGFRQGGSADRLRAGGRHDVAYALERNEWNGAVSPRMTLRAVALAPADAAPAAGMCATACGARCPSLAPDGEPARPPLALGGGGRLVDVRGRGVQIATVARLLAAGESVLVLVADVARRRAALAGPLHPDRFGGVGAALFSERCAAAALARRLEGLPAGPAVAMADYPTAVSLPGLWDRFPHAVALDPPPDEAYGGLLADPPAGAELHLVWGGDEVEFARSVARERHELRPALARLWRLRRGGGDDPAQHAPVPETVARCLRVFREVGLDRPPPAGEKVDLHVSATYRESLERLERALAFLATVEGAAPAA